MLSITHISPSCEVAGIILLGYPHGESWFCVWSRGRCFLFSFFLYHPLVPDPRGGAFPQPQFPHATCGNHGNTQMVSGLKAKPFVGKRQAIPSATGTKALPLSIDPIGPNRQLTLKHRNAWQPGQMAIKPSEWGDPQVLEGLSL